MLYLAPTLPALAEVVPETTKAAADTLTVCQTGCDHTLIQDAIGSATTGDTIEVLDAVHTESVIVVTQTLTILGQGAANTIVQAGTLPGTALSSVFRIDAGVTATIEGMTIRHGHVLAAASATAWASAQSPPLNAHVSASAGASASSLGGGVLNKGTLVLLECEVRDNLVVAEAVAEATAEALGEGDATAWATAAADALARGGAIFNQGMLTVERCAITDNTAVVTVTASAHVSATSSTGVTVGENAEADATGEALAAGIYNPGVLTITNSTISGNPAESDVSAEDDRDVAPPTVAAAQVVQGQGPGHQVVVRRVVGDGGGPIQVSSAAGDHPRRHPGTLSIQSTSSSGGDTTSATANSTGGIHSDDQATVSFATVTDNASSASAQATSLAPRLMRTSSPAPAQPQPSQ